jgi:hypothetical protein
MLLFPAVKAWFIHYGPLNQKILDQILDKIDKITRRAKMLLRKNEDIMKKRESGVCGGSRARLKRRRMQ